MPLYANTHTQNSASGKQTNLAREEARAIIKRSCNAPTEDYACIFTGSGSTSAIDLIVKKLKLKQICDQIKQSQTKQEKLNNYNVMADSLQFFKKNDENSYECTLCKVSVASEEDYKIHATNYFHKREVDITINQSSKNKNYRELPVVFISTFEHHSNILSWRETGARIEVIPLTSEGDFDYLYLEQKLKTYKK
jgi:selenocysteine lyase/cysteine desulfurase